LTVRIDEIVGTLLEAWHELIKDSVEMKKIVEEAIIKYRDFFDFLDLVAEEKGIKVEEAPLKKYALFINFCQYLDDLVNKEIQELGNNYKVLELLK